MRVSLITRGTVDLRSDGTKIAIVVDAPENPKLTDLGTFKLLNDDGVEASGLDLSLTPPSSASYGKYCALGPAA